MNAGFSTADKQHIWLPLGTRSDEFEEFASKGNQKSFIRNWLTKYGKGVCSLQCIDYTVIEIFHELYKIYIYSIPICN